jgi:hypothetical protein
MLRAEDMGDTFWNVKAREQEEEDRLRRDILEITVQIETVSKIDALRHAPGFQDFLKAMQAQHAVARERLIGDNRLTNDGLREQRGRVKGLESVLALLTKPQISETLAQQLAERKNQLASAMQRRPKTKTEEPQVTP